MKLARVAVVASKEWREILRDRLFFALAFVVPTSLMLMFGYGLSFDVENIPFVVLDLDRTAASRAWTHRFIDSRYFDYRGHVHRQAQLDDLLTDNRARAAVVIPDGFGERLAAGRSADAQVLVDGTFPFRAQVTQGYVAGIAVSGQAERLARSLQRQRGLSARRAQAILEPVPLEVRYLYNRSLESIHSLAPKLIMVILMISPPLLTALGVVREKETGTIYNIYASTVSRVEFLLGKLLLYVAISLVNAVILFALATGLLGAPFGGDPLFFAVATAIYIVCTTGIGLVVSVLVRTQVSAMVITILVTLIPAVLYSGVLIPIPSLSPSARFASRLIPAQYYADAVVGSFLQDLGFASLWPDLAVLAAYAAVLLAAGLALFSKRPAR